jgi:predicted nucleotidyltransferase
LIELESYLTGKFTGKVDLVMRNALKPTIGQGFMDVVVGK